MYCLCTINVNSGVPIDIKVENDSTTYTDITDGTVTTFSVGNFSGIGSQSFIVKKGAKVTYKAQNDTHIAKGEFYITDDKVNTNNVCIENVSLTQYKFYSNSRSWDLVDKGTWLTGHPEWVQKGDLNGSSDAILRLRNKNESGTITLTFNQTNYNSNWKLTVKDYKVGTDAGNSKMQIIVYDKNGNQIDNKTSGFAKKDTNYFVSYTYTNKNIKTVKIIFSTTSILDKRFWLSSVYIENTDLIN